VLPNSSTGNYNTATGASALFANQMGVENTATGFYALTGNGSGGGNTATGAYALQRNNTGSNNTAEGYYALTALTTGSNNTALGSNAGNQLTTGSNNIIIGANVVGNASDTSTTRIGTSTQKKAFIGGISGKTAPGTSAAVYINQRSIGHNSIFGSLQRQSKRACRPVAILLLPPVTFRYKEELDPMGKLGVTTSSARFKEAIKPMDTDSEAILTLKPVSFRYKEEIDPDRIPQFGLIAEEVEKVDRRLVGRDDQGKVNTVRYEAVNAMLLNEFLKEHRTVEEQQATINELKSRMAKQELVAQEQKQLQSAVAQQQRQIELLTAGLQKISAEIELSKAATTVATRNR